MVSMDSRRTAARIGLAAAGLAVLFVSSELEEVLQLAAELRQNDKVVAELPVEALSSGVVTFSSDIDCPHMGSRGWPGPVLVQFVGERVGDLAGPQRPVQVGGAASASADNATARPASTTPAP